MAAVNPNSSPSLTPDKGRWDSRGPWGSKHQSNTRRPGTGRDRTVTGGQWTSGPGRDGLPAACTHGWRYGTASASGEGAYPYRPAIGTRVGAGRIRTLGLVGLVLPLVRLCLSRYGAGCGYGAPIACACLAAILCLDALGMDASGMVWEGVYFGVCNKVWGLARQLPGCGETGSARTPGVSGTLRTRPPY